MSPRERRLSSSLAVELKGVSITKGPLVLDNGEWADGYEDVKSNQIKPQL